MTRNNDNNKRNNNNDKTMYLIKLNNKKAPLFVYLLARSLDPSFALLLTSICKHMKGNTRVKLSK